jgi:zinc/manganese transport system substrate-binding protein
MTTRHLLRLGAAAVVLVAATACGDESGERTQPTIQVDGKPLVVVTYSVLGDVVEQLVGDAATVEVVIPNGQDPHEYSPSAKDLERMMGAALVVSNGLDLEEGLEDALGQVADDGVPTFQVTDHVTVREPQEGEPEEAHEGEEHKDEEHKDDEHGHDHGGGDPHVWTDPLTMSEMLPALGEALGSAIGVDLTSQVAAVQTAMTELDAEVRTIMADVPNGECELVTGHDSLGYFADRYGCTLIGAVIPSLSSTAEATASDIAALTDTATAAGVQAIFTEVGTPLEVAEEIATAVGVPVVELPSHVLPDEGGYRAFIVDLATRITRGLVGAG